MALSFNISPTCRANEADGRYSANLGPGLVRPPAPTAGAFFFGKFVVSADSAPAPQIAPLPGNGSDEQMFGEKEQVRHGGRSD